MIPDHARVENEPPNAQSASPGRWVEQKFAVFILAVLPTDGSNSALYDQDISAGSLLSYWCFLNAIVVITC